MEQSMKSLGVIIALTLSVFLLACGGKNNQNVDSATSGSITISADEGLKPIVEAELAVFESIYPDAHIRVVYTNEKEAIHMLCNDSARIAIVTRDLLPDEKAQFDQVKITPRYSPVAYDAIAVLLNKNVDDTVFTMDQLASMLNGKFKTWHDLNAQLSEKKFNVVFDHAESGIVRHCRDSLLAGAKLSDQCFAVNSNVKVIEEVEKNPNSIGLIGVSWISDEDDSVLHSFSKRIRVARLVPIHPETAEAASMRPYQAYISLKQYPLWRKVQVVSREARVGLGTGFASFIASDKGQRIILKSGLVPALAPIRIIQLK